MQPAASWQFTPSAARRSFPPAGSPGPPPGSPTTTAPTATPISGSFFSRHPSPGSCQLYEKPADKASLAELGKTIGASTRTLSRLFRNELGMTFYEWRTQLRIYHALVLLADGHDTTQTAYACGWANPSGFIAAFTDIIGTTPGRYRASRQNAARGS